MTDITADFNVCLKGRESQLVLPKQYDLQRIETFLQEAYSIVWPSQVSAHDHLS